MNLALLTKWWWRFFSNANLQWVTLLEHLYYTRRRPTRERITFRPHSQWWKSVLETRDIFKYGTSFAIGDGSKASFWLDIWCGSISLSSAFSHIFENVSRKTSKVRDCCGATGGWKWDKILRGFAPTSQSDRDLILELKATVNIVALSNTQDEIRWRWTKTECFSVKSLYAFLQDGGVSDGCSTHLWRTRGPLKVKVFGWLLLKRRLLTKDNLLKRGWTGDPECALCGMAAETVDHLFLRCPTTRSLLLWALTNKRSLLTSSSVGKL